jgi:hypothetical protein
MPVSLPSAPCPPGTDRPMGAGRDAWVGFWVEGACQHRSPQVHGVKAHTGRDQGRSRSKWQVARTPACPSGPVFPDRVLADCMPTATWTKSALVAFPLDHSGW